MWYLCLNPDVERKLAAEIVSVMGDSRSPSYQQLTEMKHLNAVLKVSWLLLVSALNDSVVACWCLGCVWPHAVNVLQM